MRMSDWISDVCSSDLDRLWVMLISYGRFIDRVGRPLAILLFGAALTILAMQLHKLQQRRLAAFQALAEERERHAEARELMIGEMAHRMKNAFARIGADRKSVV